MSVRRAADPASVEDGVLHRSSTVGTSDNRAIARTALTGAASGQRQRVARMKPTAMKANPMRTLTRALRSRITGMSGPAR